VHVTSEVPAPLAESLCEVTSPVSPRVAHLLPLVTDFCGVHLLSGGGVGWHAVGHDHAHAAVTHPTSHTHEGRHETSAHSLLDWSARASGVDLLEHVSCTTTLDLTAVVREADSLSAGRDTLQTHLFCWEVLLHTGTDVVVDAERCEGRTTHALTRQHHLVCPVRQTQAFIRSTVVFFGKGGGRQGDNSDDDWDQHGEVASLET